MIYALNDTEQQLRGPLAGTGERGIYVGTGDVEYGDGRVGLSTCFKIKVGRRNKLVYTTNATCWPNIFPGLPNAKQTRPNTRRGTAISSDCAEASPSPTAPTHAHQSDAELRISFSPDSGAVDAAIDMLYADGYPSISDGLNRAGERLSLAGGLRAGDG